MILAGRFTDWWVCLIAPLIGGALAVTAYDQLLRRGRTPDANTPATAGPEPT